MIYFTSSLTDCTLCYLFLTYIPWEYQAAMPHIQELILWAPWTCRLREKSGEYTEIHQITRPVTESVGQKKYAIITGLKKTDDSLEKTTKRVHNLRKGKDIGMLIYKEKRYDTNIKG